MNDIDQLTHSITWKSLMSNHAYLVRNDRVEIRREIVDMILISTDDSMDISTMSATKEFINEF